MKRIVTRGVSINLSEYEQELIWKLYDKGYELGDDENKIQKVEVIKKEECHLFRMSQSEPVVRMSLQRISDEDINFEGSVIIQNVPKGFGVPYDYLYMKVEGEFAL